VCSGQYINRQKCFLGIDRGEGHSEAPENAGVPLLVTKIFVWLIAFPFPWCTFNQIQEKVVFDSTVSFILNVSNFVTADLYL
jgi:hypothetical protein